MAENADIRAALDKRKGEIKLEARTLEKKLQDRLEVESRKVSIRDSKMILPVPQRRYETVDHDGNDELVTFPSYWRPSEAHAVELRKRGIEGEFITMYDWWRIVRASFLAETSPFCKALLELYFVRPVALGVLAQVDYVLQPGSRSPASGFPMDHVEHSYFRVTHAKRGETSLQKVRRAGDQYCLCWDLVAPNKHQSLLSWLREDDAGDDVGADDGAGEAGSRLALMGVRVRATELGFRPDQGVMVVESAEDEEFEDLISFVARWRALKTWTSTLDKAEKKLAELKESAKHPRLSLKKPKPKTKSGPRPKAEGKSQKRTPKDQREDRLEGGEDPRMLGEEDFIEELMLGEAELKPRKDPAKKEESKGSQDKEEEALKVEVPILFAWFLFSVCLGSLRLRYRGDSESPNDIEAQIASQIIIMTSPQGTSSSLRRPAAQVFKRPENPDLARLFGADRATDQLRHMTTRGIDERKSSESQHPQGAAINSFGIVILRRFNEPYTCNPKAKFSYGRWNKAENDEDLARFNGRVHSNQFRLEDVNLFARRAELIIRAATVWYQNTSGRVLTNADQKSRDILKDHEGYVILPLAALRKQFNDAKDELLAKLRKVPTGHGDPNRIEQWEVSLVSDLIFRPSSCAFPRCALRRCATGLAWAPSQTLGTVLMLL